MEGKIMYKSRTKKIPSSEDIIGMSGVETLHPGGFDLSKHNPLYSEEWSGMHVQSGAKYINSKKKVYNISTRDTAGMC